MPRKPSMRSRESGFATRRPSGTPVEGTAPRPRVSPGRALLAGLVFVPLALASGAYSFAVALDTRQPQISHTLYGELPKAKVRLADLAIAEAVTDIAEPDGSDLRTGPDDRPTPPNANELAARLPRDTRLRIEARALSGLSDTPYSSGALRQLAFIEPDAARRQSLLYLARRVSRRDVSAATLLAEQQFQSGEMDAGLATLDQALEISDALDDRIFPLILGAAKVPRFESVLRKRLARDPAWAERLARHAASTAPSAPLFARIADGFPDMSRARSLDYGTQLVDGLATRLELDAAFAAYRAYSRRPQDVEAFGTGLLAPLDWRLIDSIDVGTRRLQASEPVVELFAQPRRAGEVARIVLGLEPGSYSLTFALADPQGDGGKLSLVRACLDEGRELASSQSTTELDAPRVGFMFTVPADCPFQSLRLGIAGGSEAISVLVDDVRFEKVATAAGTAR